MHWSSPEQGKSRKEGSRKAIERLAAWLATALFAAAAFVLRHLLRLPARDSGGSHRPQATPDHPPAGQSSSSSLRTLRLLIAAITAIAMLIGAIAALVTALHSGDHESPTVICRHVATCVRPPATH